MYYLQQFCHFRDMGRGLYGVEGLGREQEDGSCKTVDLQRGMYLVKWRSNQTSWFPPLASSVDLNTPTFRAKTLSRVPYGIPQNGDTTTISRASE